MMTDRHQKTKWRRYVTSISLSIETGQISQQYEEINQQKLASQLNNKQNNMHNIIINADINYIALFTS